MELPDINQIYKTEDLLRQLPFPYYLDSLVKIKRTTGNKRNIYWFQVCLNPRVKYFMQKYADDLTAMENGVLYGYPLSAIRACSNLIDQGRPEYKTACDYFFGRIPSKGFYGKEKEDNYRQWERVRKISAEIIRQAEEEFEKFSE